MVEALTKETFIQKISDIGGEFKFKGDKPVVIDFFALWCGPCKQIAPIVEDLSKEYDGKIDIYKIDTDEQPELASLFEIQSIPSILFIPVIGQPKMSMGAIPKTAFKKAFKEVFNID